MSKQTNEKPSHTFNETFTKSIVTNASILHNNTIHTDRYMYAFHAGMNFDTNFSFQQHNENSLI